MFDREWCLLSVRCEKDLGVFVKVQGLIAKNSVVSFNLLIVKR